MAGEDVRYSRRAARRISGRAAGPATVAVALPGRAGAVAPAPPVPVVDPANLDPLRLSVDFPAPEVGRGR